jgi:hypothetical protein
MRMRGVQPLLHCLNSPEITQRPVNDSIAQLTLWTLGPDEWLFYKKLPEYAPRKKRTKLGVLQLPLPELTVGRTPHKHEAPTL